MSIVRRVLAITVLAGSCCLLLGCERKPAPGQAVPLVADQLVRDVKNAPSPVNRLVAVSDLAKLPPEQIKPFVSELQTIQTQERDPRIKKAIKELLDKVK